MRECTLQSYKGQRKRVFRLLLMLVACAAVSGEVRVWVLLKRQHKEDIIQRTLAIIPWHSFAASKEQIIFSHDRFLF